MFNLPQGMEPDFVPTFFLILRNDWQTSTTYNVFSILQLPIPNARSGRISIERCLDAFFNEEILEKDDAWYVWTSLGCAMLGSTFIFRDCPQCKVKRRASKRLSLARLPPVLMVHFKRFEANGRFSDKIDTFVDFPMKSLDLTNYMPPPLPPGVDKSQLNGGLPLSLEDPRSQLPPYRYDLYGVTNHYGNLSSGHCEFLDYSYLISYLFLNFRYRIHCITRWLDVLR
jgi:ubiquitin carboxyl-terminal hydrolase 8